MQRLPPYLLSPGHQRNCLSETQFWCLFPVLKGIPQQSSIYGMWLSRPFEPSTRFQTHMKGRVTSWFGRRNGERTRSAQQSCPQGKPVTHASASGVTALPPDCILLSVLEAEVLPLKETLPTEPMPVRWVLPTGIQKPRCFKPLQSSRYCYSV